MRETEVGRLGPRFRPSYYTLRLIETSLWGNRPEDWYAARMAMFVLCGILSWLCLYAWIGILPATLVLVFALSPHYWADIWCRLGPAETYCAVGTLLFIYGALRLARADALTRNTNRRGGQWWCFIVSGVLIASGSKENFLLLVPATWFVALVVWYRGQFGRAAVMSLVVVTGWGYFIFTRVIKVLAAMGGDVYGNSVEPIQRIVVACKPLGDMLNAVGWWNLAALIITCVGAFFLIGDRNRGKYYLTNVGIFFLVSSTLLSLYFSQLVFYNGQLPTGTRYDFPGVLLGTMFWVVLAFFFLRICPSLGIHPAIRDALRAGLLIGLCCLISLKGFSSLQRKCCKNASVTQAFTSKFNAAVQRLRADPSRPLVILGCNTVWCSEPVKSSVRFLKASGVVNPLFIRIENIVPASSFEVRLLDNLKRSSVEGNWRRGWLPISELPENIKPFVIGLGCEPDIPMSISLGSFRW